MALFLFRHQRVQRSSMDHPGLTHDLNPLWCHITLYPWVPGTIQYLPMIGTPCGDTLHWTLHSHEFQGPFNTYSWSKFNIWYHTTLCSTLTLIPGTTQYLPMIWTPCGDTLHFILPSHEFHGPSSTYPWSELPLVPHYIVLYTSMSFRDHPVLTHDLNSLWDHITLHSTLPWVPGTI